MDHQTHGHPWSDSLVPAVDASANTWNIVAAETRSSPTELDVWTTDMDRKTKKRIQNRVAQRTYRSRMRQRLQELQREISEMRTGRRSDGQCEQLSEPGFQVLESAARISGLAGSGPSAFYTTISGTKPNLPGLGLVGHEVGPTSADVAGHSASNTYDMLPELWFGLPDDSLWNNTDQRQVRPAVSPSPTSPSRTLSEVSSLQPASTAAMQSRLPPSLNSGGPRAIAPRNTVLDSGNPGSLSTLSPLPVSPGISSAAKVVFALPPKGSENSGLSSPRDSPATNKTPTHSTTATATATPATDPPEDTKIPGPHATLEDRFSYVLDCARRVDLGWDFDALATQYYTHSFEPGSALALEQRLSRNRRLPGLLSQLRPCSSTWGASQRRGYEDETLKTAEEICVRELSEFYAKKRQQGGKTREGVGEAKGGEQEEEGDEGSDAFMFEDHLPNLWALLTGLVSNDPLIQPSKRTSVAYMCMELLCGEAPGASKG